ncbi:hypothetical protein MRBBS_0668 [Marinobacter sp. BSs20148]|nr:hypothetical protein MRBBS_0668 [Marinobacter sp. BSs20148]
MGDDTHSSQYFAVVYGIYSSLRSNSHVLEILGKPELQHTQALAIAGAAVKGKSLVFGL